ncbi:MAG TPA: PLP-dependent aminotransferase family protein [Tepidisphaeraceae bacterium]|jgi:DNA-binding transcriptional MocR family regulator|nr:PLP-dependent aminotransferase family protein [Tepidisphaeraceae bacterium]
MPTATADNLYEQTAAYITTLIDGGTLRAGDRLPSVRKLSTQRGVSIATVLTAYRLLEDAGRIKARPQSGYYVAPRASGVASEPGMSQPRAKAGPVSISDLVLKFLQESKAPETVGLGAAVSGCDLLPTRKINRMAASIARRMPRAASGYDMPPGCPALRMQLARRAVEFGCALSPDDILTTCGSQEALSICLRAIARPGGTVAIESPTYYGVLQTIEMTGLKALELPTCPREGVSLDALQFALDQGAVQSCLFVPNFHNPLGFCTSESHKRKLVKMLAERDVPLIEDDIYGDLPFDNKRPKACKAFDEKGLVLYCSSFSKTLAAGFRVGWCAPGRYYDEVVRLKLFTSLATPTLAQLTIAEFMATGGYEHHLRTVRRQYQKQVARLSQLVSEHFPKGTKITRPAGGFVIWVQMPAQIDSMELHDRAMTKGISIAPGIIFSPKQKYRNFIRLNAGLDWSDRVDWAVAKVGEIAHELLTEASADARRSS